MRQAALVARLRAGASLLGLAAGLAAGASLRRAAVRLVAVPNRSFDELTQEFILDVIATLFQITKRAFSLRSETEEMLSSPVVLFLIPSIIVLLFLYLMQKFGQIWLICSFLLKTREEKKNERYIRAAITNE